MIELKPMFPPSRGRVVRHSPHASNRNVVESMVDSVEDHIGTGRHRLDRRLRQLETEWDMERMLEANAAGISLLGLALGAAVDRKFFILPAVVAGFLLQHALQGWCPPVEVFRRLGIRTTEEIDAERYALKLLRGDFDAVTGQSTGGRTLAQAIVNAVGPHEGFGNGRHTGSDSHARQEVPAAFEREQDSCWSK